MNYKEINKGNILEMNAQTNMNDIIEITEYLQNVILPQLVEDYYFMTDIWSGKYEDKDEMIEAFINNAFNDWKDKNDVAKDEDYVKLFEKSKSLIVAINHNRDIKESHFGDDSMGELSVENVAREFAYYYFIERRHLIDFKIIFECCNCDKEHDFNDWANYEGMCEECYAEEHQIELEDNERQEDSSDEEEEEDDEVVA
jgi:hypothetical protein